MVLEEWGHAVVVTGSTGTPDASEWQKADLVLVALGPSGTGVLDAVAAVRDRESGTGGHIPVIAVVADTESSGPAACVEAGADGCVSMPLDPEALNSEIDRLGPVVARWRLTRACLDPAAWSQGWEACAKSRYAVRAAQRVRRFALPGT
jgi:CheY-like chemotaxis protein